MTGFDTYFRVIFLGSTLLFLTLFTQKQTDRFTLRGITPAHDNDLVFAPIASEQVKEALAQPYDYFVSGGQAFVFQSRDRQYILKLPKQRLYRRSWWLNHLPLPVFLQRYKEKRNYKRTDKWARDFFSYTQAYKHLKNESGLLYCHLGKSAHLNQKLTLIDRLNIGHTIDLDQVDFILQKRAETVAERIARLHKQPQALKETFKQIVAVTKQCLDKELYNRDPFIPHNCGFIDDQSIQIDVGRFVKKENMDQAQEMERIFTPFISWISAHYPEHVTLLKQEVFDETAH